MSSPENRSYLVPGLGGLSPWSSRSSTPKSGPSAGVGESPLGRQQGGDHSVGHRYRLSSKRYPRDCPPLNVKWFYAVDVPKRKPNPPAQPPKDDNPAPVPKKYVPFSPPDSRSIEVAFQKLADEEDAEESKPGPDHGDASKPSSTIKDSEDAARGSISKVPVNEDYLFDVDIQKRELAPVYWLGPIYEVRRGTWFYQEGSSLRTCDENLATQLEEGYIKVKPWRYSPLQPPPKAAQSRPVSSTLKAPDNSDIWGEPTTESFKDDKSDDSKNEAPVAQQPSSPQQPRLQTHRLFGAYMNSIVTYQDSTTAWIVSDDFISRMSSTVYQRFAGGGHLGGVKVVRGYTEPGKVKDGKVDEEKKLDDSATGTKPAETTTDEQQRKELAQKRRSAPPSISSADSSEQQVINPESEARRQALERDMTNFVSSTESEDPEKREEEARRRDEKEIQDDYKGDGGDQGREIEHLILVTHGIGQRLGLRVESVNFVHDVNMLRKTLKNIYTSSPDLQALNSEVEKLPKNCRVQVLPVCWRHLLDFPKQSLRQNRKEHDLGDADAFADEEEYPSLADITVEGVPAVRSLITDLALDILLYQSAYREHISGIVLRECNRIYKLFLERNPEFHGQISLIGHSLGSAIVFDILCRQKEEQKRPVSRLGQSKSTKDRSASGKDGGNNPNMDFDFPVDNLFCLGSPIGLFQMLKGRTISARQRPQAFPSESPLNPDSLDDPFSTSSSSDPVAAERMAAEKSASSAYLPVTVSSPKCRQLFNIFHPTDPISYRIEPLISPAMSTLKPQPLPYTKRGIFGAPMGQGLTGIGARVGQSVTGLWTSFSSGIASNILNRSLGFTGEEGRGDQSGSSSSSRMPIQRSQSASHQLNQSRVPLSIGAGTNISGGGVIPNNTGPFPPQGKAESDSQEQPLAASQMGTGANPNHAPTLIDSEIETLYAGFQKRRKSQQSDGGRDLGESPEWQEAEERGRKLRNEEAKVRALNGNGRVDFSIQEGVFDISLIASIASHLSYWADEDVSHFVLSQLLSRQDNQAKKDSR